jgi:Lrp/AsnC family transcriptional regulator, leucine-responsive regulatory protein
MLDRIDKKILEILQSDNQISNQDLAQRVSLSPTPCLRRVKQLVANGVISKQVALLNPDVLGLKLTIMVLVGLDKHSAKKMAAFEQAICEFSEVLECHLITGQSADYILKVIVPDMTAYQAFLLNRLMPLEGVNNIQSSFVLQSIINKSALPLDLN